MSNTIDKTREVIEAALVALIAVSSSSKYVKQTEDSTGIKMTPESEIVVIHSIADEAVEALHDYLDLVDQLQKELSQQ
tara:strand:- start:2108 stop:2341 length:234 start_codon:yes stop_codon:yes gene_type:complete